MVAVNAGLILFFPVQALETALRVLALSATGIRVTPLVILRCLFLVSVLMFVFAEARCLALFCTVFLQDAHSILAIAFLPATHACKAGGCRLIDTEARARRPAWLNVDGMAPAIAVFQTPSALSIHCPSIGQETLYLEFQWSICGQCSKNQMLPAFSTQLVLFSRVQVVLNSGTPPACTGAVGVIIIAISQPASHALGAKGLFPMMELLNADIYPMALPFRGNSISSALCRNDSV